VERNEKEQLVKERLVFNATKLIYYSVYRELLIECHQNRLQELQEHFKGEKEKVSTSRAVEPASICLWSPMRLTLVTTSVNMQS